MRTLILIACVLLTASAASAKSGGAAGFPGTGSTGISGAGSGGGTSGAGGGDAGGGGGGGDAGGDAMDWSFDDDEEEPAAGFAPFEGVYDDAEDLGDGGEDFGGDDGLE